MKVKILRDTVADGRDVYAGDVYDISDSDARLLIRMGKALAEEGGEEAKGGILTTKNGPEKGDPFEEAQVEAKKPGRPKKG